MYELVKAVDVVKAELEHAQLKGISSGEIKRLRHQYAILVSVCNHRYGTDWLGMSRKDIL
jgi:hypothetical protein